MTILWLVVTSCSLGDLDGLSSGASNTGGGASGAAGLGGTSIGVDASAGSAGNATGGSGGTTTGGSAGRGGLSGSGGSAPMDVRDGSSAGDARIDGAAGSGGSTDGASGAAGSAADGAGGSNTGGASGTGGFAGAGGSAIDAGLDTPSPSPPVFAVGSFVKSSAIGMQIVTHTLGQVPKAIIVWTAGKTNETLSGGFYLGIGVSDGTASAAISMSTRDQTSPSSSSRRIAPKIITLVQGGETTLAEADLASASAANIRLNWTVNDGQPYVIHYLAIGGSDVSAKLVNWQTPTTTGTKSISGLGFQPEAVLHFHVGSSLSTTPPWSQSNGVIGMGVMNKAGAQWSVQVADATGSSPTISTRAQRTDAALYMYHAPSAVLNKSASFVSMDPGGFTLNFTTANSDAGQVYSLAIAGLQTNIGTFAKSTATAPASQAVPTPFAPGAVFLSSYQMGPQTATVRESQCSWGLGASDGTNSGTSAIVADDAFSTTNVDGLDKTSKVFVKVNHAPLDAEADLASLDPAGFSLNWTTNDPVASQICFLAFGAP